MILKATKKTKRGTKRGYQLGHCKSDTEASGGPLEGAAWVTREKREAEEIT